MSNRTAQPNGNARHWSAPDAQEEVWHDWPSGPVWSSRSLCDDGARLLHPNERRMFDAALAAALESPERCAWIYEGDLSMCVNLDLKGNPPRWGLSNRERHLSGGFIYETQVPQIDRQREIHIRDLPPVIIDHREQAPDADARHPRVTLFGKTVW